MAIYYVLFIIIVSDFLSWEKIIFCYDRKKIENYLAQSSDLTDLENRMKDLDKQGAYNKFYI